MGFRDEYLWTGKTYAEWTLGQATRSGFSKSHQLQIALAETFATEISGLQTSIAKAAEAGERGLANAVQRICDSVDTGLLEVRWAVERHTRISESILNVLLNSLANESRQYYEQGVVWYEAGEYKLAKAAFHRALEKSSVNDFAYQYLGFIAVVEENVDEAITNFDRAAKCATTDYHRAMALAHLARVYYVQNAIGNAIKYVGVSSQLQPRTARYWYDLAVYNAVASNIDNVQEALRVAVEIDPSFWSRAKHEKAFEPVQGAVDVVLEAYAAKEKAYVDDALRAFSTVQPVATGPDMLREIEVMHSRFQAALEAAEIHGYRGVREEVLEAATRLCRQIQGELRQRMTQMEANHKQQRNTLERPLAFPRKVRDTIGGTLASTFNDFDAGCLFGIILLVLWPITAIALVVLICAGAVLGVKKRKINPLILAEIRTYESTRRDVNALLLSVDAVLGHIRSEAERKLDSGSNEVGDWLDTF